MNKVTVNVKTLHGEVIKTYELDYISELSLGDLYEEARSVWAEYYVELQSKDWIMSRDFTYEQEMIMLNEEESYKQFLTLSEI
jgi:hypothetical protein